MTNSRVRRQLPYRAPMFGQQWWYVIWHKDGQDVLSGPYKDQTEGTNKGMMGRRRDGTPYQFDVKSYPTKDRGLATQMYKQNRLDSGQASLDESLERMGHQIPGEEKD